MAAFIPCRGWEPPDCGRTSPLWSDCLAYPRLFLARRSRRLLGRVSSDVFPVPFPTWAESQGTFRLSGGRRLWDMLFGHGCPRSAGGTNEMRGNYKASGLGWAFGAAFTAPWGYAFWLTGQRLPHRRRRADHHHDHVPQPRAFLCRPSALLDLLRSQRRWPFDVFPAGLGPLLPELDAARGVSLDPFSHYGAG